jgi:hypothetical protein
MATLFSHSARTNASNFAFELLADELSQETLPRSAVRAVFRIGLRDQAEATAAEWALLHLTELALVLQSSTPQRVEAAREIC